ncbi:hypothetical protein TNCV_2289941 [Trichonephila clavipes]|uniref:Uncharacterized protein n=1 Tax=Trichonephila clavipes TaxID=2585209 RepID=A0A8X6V7M6_TRICX|nr:hypothetical protein TNCV_2289941 [Trichonephila clavipes]
MSVIESSVVESSETELSEIELSPESSVIELSPESKYSSYCCMRWLSNISGSGMVLEFEGKCLKYLEENNKVPSEYLLLKNKD